MFPLLEARLHAKVARLPRMVKIMQYELRTACLARSDPGVTSKVPRTAHGGLPHCIGASMRVPLHLPLCARSVQITREVAYVEAKYGEAAELHTYLGWRHYGLPLLLQLFILLQCVLQVCQWNAAVAPT